MSQFLDPNDLWTENATGYGVRVTGYKRWQPWTSDPLPSGGTGYGIPCATVPQLHHGYGSNGAAFFNNTANTLGACLWRPQYATDLKASITFFVAGIVNADDFRYAGVCGRCSGGTFNETANSERYLGGDAYWFMFVNDAAHNVAGNTAFKIVRVNGGVITSVGSATGPAASTLPTLLSTPYELTMSITTGAGSTPHIDCTANGVLVFSFNDIDASAITAPGRWGFGMNRDRLGTAPCAQFFQLVDIATTTVVHRDEWARSNTLVANTIGPDTNSVQGPDMMCMWGSDEHSQFSTLFIADPGQNRAKNVTSNPTRAVSMRSATSNTQARRSLIVTYSGVAGHVESVQMFLRATGLDQMNVSTTNPAYGAVLKWQAGTFTAQLFFSMVSTGTAIIASAVVGGLSTGTNITLDFQTINVLGKPQLLFKINGVVPTWVMGPAPLFTLLADGSVRDDRASPYLTGSEEGFSLGNSSSGGGAQITCDSWLDLVPVIPQGQAHVSQSLLEGFARLFVNPADAVLVPDGRVSQSLLEGFYAQDIAAHVSQSLLEGFYTTQTASARVSQALLEGFFAQGDAPIENCLALAASTPQMERGHAATSGVQAISAAAGKMERGLARGPMVAALSAGGPVVERLGVTCR